MDAYFTPAQTKKTEDLHEALIAIDPVATKAALAAAADTSRKMGSSELNAVHRLLWLDPWTTQEDLDLALRHTQCFQLLLEGGHVKMASTMIKGYSVYQALDGRWQACARLWIERQGSAKATATLKTPSRRHEALRQDWWGPLLDLARLEEQVKRLERKLPQAFPGRTKPRM